MKKLARLFCLSLSSEGVFEKRIRTEKSLMEIESVLEDGEFRPDGSEQTIGGAEIGEKDRSGIAC
jgi:hypothetical protein